MLLWLFVPAYGQVTRKAELGTVRLGMAQARNDRSNGAHREHAQALREDTEAPPLSRLKSGQQFKRIE